MRANYVFHSEWNLPASPSVVHRVLSDYERYPLWWPQVRVVQQGDRGLVTVVRSALPYELRLEMVAHRLEGQVLAAEIFGDLEGTAEWVLHATGAGTLAVYDQHVALTKPLLRHLSPLLRPALRANHTWMMRAGQRGLRAYLAGFQAAGGA